MKRTSLVTVAVAALLLALTGCAVPDSATEPSPSASATPTSTPSSKPSPTPTATEVSAAPAPESTSVDRSYEAKTVGGGIISKATEEPIGTITLYTDIAQPYSDAQSAARYEALSACEAVRTQMGATTVIVMDASEKPFIFFNGTNYLTCGFSR